MVRRHPRRAANGRAAQSRRVLLDGGVEAVIDRTSLRAKTWMADAVSAVRYAPPMRHETMPRADARPVTNRRLQAARRALLRERDACPLFAGDIAEEQPTPEERVRAMDAEHVAYWQRIRDYNARTWRSARRILCSLPAEEQDRLRAQWQAAPYPASASSFADFLWQRTGRSASRERAEEEDRSVAQKEPRA